MEFTSKAARTTALLHIGGAVMIIYLLTQGHISLLVIEIASTGKQKYT